MLLIAPKPLLQHGTEITYKQRDLLGEQTGEKQQSDSTSLWALNWHQTTKSKEVEKELR